MAHSNDSASLEIPLPARRHETLGLVIFRRMAAHGLHDARATMLALDVGGQNFRRMLILSRALVVDLARASRRRIVLAPCCATGMTRDEGLLMELIKGGGLDVYAALTDDASCAAGLTTAHAYGEELDQVARRNGWRH
ncbi:hypothetical protein K3175_09255 [Qipengyuania sp. GH1]|uniref:DUF6628 family protein n=1 Tax=Qipengyuania aestuarii TaxID=2867241 RepID=UPI001C87DF4C|nr:DUF6628 family protein [Qipengyuania aestuarii]MBX7535850.1 hypothetical protein [Qipengyuania aestuarii]